MLIFCLVFCCQCSCNECIIFVGPVAGFEAEARSFGELAMTPECAGLISLFHGQTECKKNAFGKPARSPKLVVFN